LDGQQRGRIPKPASQNRHRQRRIFRNGPWQQHPAQLPAHALCRFHFRRFLRRIWPSGKFLAPRSLCHAVLPGDKARDHIREILWGNGGRGPQPQHRDTSTGQYGHLRTPRASWRPHAADGFLGRNIGAFHLHILRHHPQREPLHRTSCCAIGFGWRNRSSNCPNGQR
jgi:hypothetical protein